MSVDIEFNSERLSDCNQAEKYLFACLGREMKVETEVVEGAETR